MKTPPMFYPQEDGKLTEIPAEHAAVLDLYRDRMPLVHEPQFFGDPIQLYPLVIEEPEPLGTPEPGDLETAARRVCGYLEAKRHGRDPAAPDFERLAVAAVRAYVLDSGVFGGSMAHEDGPRAVERAITRETARAGRRLHKAVDRAVSEETANLVENWWVKS
ncbi:hypothetical protein ACFYVL_39990 [Streptomyces sp. NPDC004111]|uniref:hypothetical protein n=1 Tax=Streptomyces sp. NPDC004111 TaxID=3364690 RepID=UPI0036A68406